MQHLQGVELPLAVVRDRRRRALRQLGCRGEEDALALQPATSVQLSS